MKARVTVQGSRSMLRGLVGVLGSFSMSLY